MFASPAVYTRRSALAAQLRKLHLGIGQIFLRDMTTVMSNIRVGRPHTFYRAHDLLTSCACTDLRSAQLTALLRATPLSQRHPDLSMQGHIKHLAPCTRRDTSDLLQAFSPPSSKGCSSGGHFLFLPLLVLSRSYSLYSGEHFLLYVFVI